MLTRQKGHICGMWMERNILITAWRLVRLFLGHSYDEVDQKVIEEIQKGILFAMTGELEVAVAEMIVEMAPAVEMVRFACSGTEATMHAIRVARAYTGRDLIVKFEGNYHGFHDHTLWSTYAPVEAYGQPPQSDPCACFLRHPEDHARIYHHPAVQ